MKTPIFVLTLALVAGSCYGQAYSGMFGTGVELTGTGAGALNSGTTTIYALEQGNDQYLDPANSTTPVSDVYTGTAANPTPSLGTFNPASGTLSLNGGSILTYQGGNATDSDAVSDAVLHYQIEDAALNYFSGFIAVNLPFNANGIGGAASSMRFSTESLTTNLLAGLAPGIYTLNIYNSSDFTETNTGTVPTTTTNGTNYDNNNNGNYGATFTVAVPEPSTWTMMLSAAAGLFGFVHLRRRANRG